MQQKTGANDQNQSTAVEVVHDAIYDLFMLAITLYSLVVIVLLLVWPLTPATRTLLVRVDLLICIIFLIDFLVNFLRSSNRSKYFFRQGGWLDLLGSVPIIIGPPLTAVLRLARLPSLVRIVRDLRAKDSKQIRRELRGDRPKTALLFTMFISMVMIAVADAVVLQVEGRSPESNIHTGADALWWAFVTITTVGYGDHYPTSGLGRLMAVILMTIGVGIFAVLTSFLASILLGDDDEQATDPSLQDEMKALRRENAAIRAQLDVIIETLAPGKRDEG